VSDDLRIDRSVTIPGNELQERFTTSGGPGGQHANRSSTRVELEWNLEASRALTERQRSRIKRSLRARIDSSGTLRVASDTYRSQWRNRGAARDRLAKLVAQALQPARRRVATRSTPASNEKRLRAKKRRGEIKRLRQDTADG
jgi:ribosome-associated protein